MLGLHVEEPLVDLDARKTSFLHGLPAHLSIPVTSQLIKEDAKVFDLVICLFAASGRMMDHARGLALVLLPDTFARHQGPHTLRAVLVACQDGDGCQLRNEVLSVIGGISRPFVVTEVVQERICILHAIIGIYKAVAECLWLYGNTSRDLVAVALKVAEGDAGLRGQALAFAYEIIVEAVVIFGPEGV